MQKTILILLPLLLALAASAAAAQRSLPSGPMTAVDLRCEYLRAPLAVDSPRPRLSWRVEDARRGAVQKAYRILVASRMDLLDRDQGDRWDSGRVESSETLHIAYAGSPLNSRDRCYWKVRVWDGDSAPSAWSAPAEWRTGLLAREDWTGDWISYRDRSPLHTSRSELFLPPARHFRREFKTSSRPVRATLYATALGVYELHLNGARVGDAYLEPGWADYRRRTYYRAYDVTDQVRSGGNALGAILTDGWYSGYVGYGLLVGYGPNRCGRYFYGKTPALRAQLELEYEDGSRETIGTDEAWRVTADGPIREADIQMGERYDARKELGAWSEPGFDHSSWEEAIPADENGSVQAVNYDTAGEREMEYGFIPPHHLQAYSTEPIRIIQEIRPVAVTEPQPGTFIFNLGQNFSGIARLRVKGPAGTEVRLRFGEMVHQDGRLMTENLRRARATDSYILKGDPAGEVWQPAFTYHGFQYVEVTGYPGTPDASAITGLVIHSDTELTSEWSCSDPLLNKLFQNIVWTQRSNFVEVPTDCPQRDERLGWTGDAQIYIPAATYNADVGAFFTKWLDDLEESQRENGAYPAYAPFPMQHGIRGYAWGTAWMDAGIICPRVIHEMYGDTRVIDRHWASMERFMAFRRQLNPDYRGVRQGNDWGDWLAVGETTPLEYIDHVYYATDARLMSEMATATGREKEAAQYQDLFERIRDEWRRLYMKPDGALGVETQTAYAMALTTEMIPLHLRKAAGDRLAQRVKANGYHLTTGFLGTQPLLPALTATGHHDVALRLLQSREFPSWGYEVVNGATTVWERWNSYTRDKGFFEPAMNSFSHYAFGAVSAWMFRSVAGIAPATSGFGRIALRPGPPSSSTSGWSDAPPLNEVKAVYRSIRGPIRMDWRRAAGGFEVSATVPANTRALLFMPARTLESVRVDGAMPEAAGALFLKMDGDRAVYELPAGSWNFTSDWK